CSAADAGRPGGAQTRQELLRRPLSPDRRRAVRGRWVGERPGQLAVRSFSKLAAALVGFAAIHLSAPAHAWQMKQAALMTDWAQQVDTNSPLPEYPRPQMV